MLPVIYDPFYFRVFMESRIIYPEIVDQISKDTKFVLLLYMILKVAWCCSAERQKRHCYFKSIFFVVYLRQLLCTFPFLFCWFCFSVAFTSWLVMIKIVWPVSIFYWHWYTANGVNKSASVTERTLDHGDRTLIKMWEKVEERSRPLLRTTAVIG